MHDKIINESKALCFDRKLLPVESVYHLRNRYRKSRDYSINLEIAQNSKIYRYPKFDHSNVFTCVSRGQPSSRVLVQITMLSQILLLTLVSVCYATIERPMGVAISSKNLHQVENIAKTKGPLMSQKTIH